MNRKIRLLAWGDFPLAATGFGTVSRHVLQALHSTGKYEIQQLAINYHGEFYSKELCPWQSTPAKILDPKDPHGLKLFPQLVEKGDYDIVWILNDLFVINEVAKFFNEFRNKCRSQGKKPPVFIYYYPVDCCVPKRTSACIEYVDTPVCFTDHGKAETLKTCPTVANRLYQIPHGVNTSQFRPAPKILINNWRKDFFNIGEDKTLVINVNRNSTRKQIPYTMLAFKEFKKQVPNSLLYLHMQKVDQGGDLDKIVEAADLKMKEDILFPANFNIANNPASIENLNKIYNCGDIFLSTHLGEGWGLSIVEAMAAGTPVVLPDNTCMKEHLGTNSERGYLYPCNDKIYIDSSGFRDKGSIPDIVAKMVECYKDGPKENNPKVKAALTYAKSVDWNKIVPKWIELLDRAIDARNTSKTLVLSEAI